MLLKVNLSNTCWGLCNVVKTHECLISSLGVHPSACPDCEVQKWQGGKCWHTPRHSFCFIAIFCLTHDAEFLKWKKKKRESFYLPNFSNNASYVDEMPLVAEQGAPQAEMAVVFHRADQRPEEAAVLSLVDAAALSYHISVRGSHLTLRCPYASPLSYTMKVILFTLH